MIYFTNLIYWSVNAYLAVWIAQSSRVVRDSIVTPELGIYANPIVIGDDLAPLSSASNPIVIHINEHSYRDKLD